MVDTVKDIDARDAWCCTRKWQLRASCFCILQLQVAQILSQQASRTWASWQQGPDVPGGSGRRSASPTRQQQQRSRSCSPSRQQQAGVRSQEAASHLDNGVGGAQHSQSRPGSPSLRGGDRREPWRPPGAGSSLAACRPGSPGRDGPSVHDSSAVTLRPRSLRTAFEAAHNVEAAAGGRHQPGLPPVQRSNKHFDSGAPTRGRPAGADAISSSWRSALQVGLCINAACSDASMPQVLSMLTTLACSRNSLQRCRFNQDALDARQSLDALLKRRPAFWAAPPRTSFAAAPCSPRRPVDSSAAKLSASALSGVAARHTAGPEGPRSIPGFLVHCRMGPAAT